MSQLRKKTKGARRAASVEEQQMRIVLAVIHFVGFSLIAGLLGLIGLAWYGLVYKDKPVPESIAPIIGGLAGVLGTLLTTAWPRRRDHEDEDEYDSEPTSVFIENSPFDPVPTAPAFAAPAFVAPAFAAPVPTAPEDKTTKETSSTNLNRSDADKSGNDKTTTDKVDKTAAVTPWGNW